MRTHHFSPTHFFLAGCYAALSAALTSSILTSPLLATVRRTVVTFAAMTFRAVILVTISLVAMSLSGCAGHEVGESYVRNPLPAAAMVTAIAEDAAAKVATLHPPGLTRIEVIYPADAKGRRLEDAFSQSLEDGLRRRGFSITPQAGLRLTWTLDAVPEAVPETTAAAVTGQGQEAMVWWYLRLKLTDGDKFATRTLTRMYGAKGLPLAGFAESKN